MKIFALPLFFLFISATVNSQDLSSVPSRCQSELRSNLEVQCEYKWIKSISVSPGISTLLVDFDGNIGLLNPFSPVEVSFNYAQRRKFEIVNGKLESTDLLWRMGLGFLVGKDSDSDLTFGIAFTPLSIRIDDFTVGVGIGYKTTDKIETNNKNFFLSIPITYSVKF